ncbi:MAG TPA: peptide ABC transporter substrate-binding protein [Anaerolineales bacterium]
MFKTRESAYFSLVVLLIVVSMILGGCGSAKTPAPGATPTVGIASPQPTPNSQTGKKVATIVWLQEFDSLNPMYSNMWYSTVTEQLWDCWAWNFDEKNDPMPYLVTEIPSLQNGDISADGMTITLHLKDGLKWSDNVPLTSEDFRFTWVMHTDMHNTVASSIPYSMVKSIETPDPLTVVMHFDTPFAPYITMWKGIIPAHILQPVFDATGTLDNAEWNMKPTVGCGPYVFAQWESGSFASFTINENFWGPKPKIDEVYFRFVPDNAAQTAALKTGDGDLGTFFPYSDIPALKSAGLNIITEPNGQNEGMFFVINPKVGNPGMADVNVRKAIAMGIDREGITRDLMLGLTSVPASYWDSFPYYNNPPLQNYPYDPEAAKKLLDQAGWVDSNGDGVREKNGVKLDFTYGTTTGEPRQDVQAVVKQQLALIGIKVELQSFESDTYFDQNGPAAKGQIDIMEWTDGPSVPDPDVYYWYCSEIPTTDYPAGSNWQYLCDNELDALLTKQTSEIDPVERQKTFTQINQIFYDKVYWLGLWQEPDRWAVNPRLTGVKFSGVTPFFNISEWDLTNK